MSTAAAVCSRVTSSKQLIAGNYENYLFNESHENSKHQKPNLKWFDKLTTLSQVEGQMPMTEIQNSKLID
jgi:hypothetical protein